MSFCIFHALNFKFLTQVNLGSFLISFNLFFMYTIYVDLFWFVLSIFLHLTFGSRPCCRRRVRRFRINSNAEKQDGGIINQDGGIINQAKMKQL